MFHAGKSLKICDRNCDLVCVMQSLGLSYVNIDTGKIEGVMNLNWKIF
jgi:hypothetical protein